MQKNKQNSLKIFSISIAVISTCIPFFATKAASTPNAPTVDDCVSRTGMTTEKCTEMISNFKNAAPKSGTKTGPPQDTADGYVKSKKEGEAIGSSSKPPVSATANSNDEETLEVKIAKITDAKKKKEDKFFQIEDHIEKLIEFLKSKNIDTAEIENNLSLFKNKAALVLEAFDACIQALNNLKTVSVTSETSNVSLDNAKAQMKTTMVDLSSFYTETLRKSLETAIGKISQQ